MITLNDIERLKKVKEVAKNAADKTVENFADLIKDVELPGWSLQYKLTHHSPSQLNSPDDVWSYKYLKLTQEQRRDLEGNSKMAAGNAMGYAMNLVFTDWIWEGLSKKRCRDYQNDKLYTKKAVEKALTAYRNYKPVNTKDAEQLPWNIQGFALTFDQLVTAFKQVPISGETHSERTVSLILDGCKLPTIGKIDLETDNLFIELKTKWRRRSGKPRSDGTMAHGLPKIALTQEWLNQVAFYYAATKKTPHLICVHEGKYEIWHPGNCDLLTPESLMGNLEDMALVARRRERLMERHQGKDTWTKDIQANFNHPFYWTLGGDHKDNAMKLWKKNG